jgi:hypothetical protein
MSSLNGVLCRQLSSMAELGIALGKNAGLIFPLILDWLLPIEQKQFKTDGTENTNEIAAPNPRLGHVDSRIREGSTETKYASGLLRFGASPYQRPTTRTIGAGPDALTGSDGLLHAPERFVVRDR